MMWRCRVMNRGFICLALIASLAIPQAAFASGGGEKKKGGGVSFVQLGAVTATVLRADGQRGAITIETGIDAPDPAVQAKVALLLPRFRAAYVQALQTYAAGLPPSGVPNADYLSREMQRQTDLVLRAKGAKFLIGTILVN
jgi:hypothetical protein